MDDWKSLNETALSETEECYSYLNIKDITDADYMHAQRVCRDFEIKKLGNYHDWYLKSDVLLLAGAFESFRKISLKIYELGPVKCISAPGLAWQEDFKKIEAKI